MFKTAVSLRLKASLIHHDIHYKYKVEGQMLYPKNINGDKYHTLLTHLFY